MIDSYLHSRSVKGYLLSVFHSGSGGIRIFFTRCQELYNYNHRKAKRVENERLKQERSSRR